MDQKLATRPLSAAHSPDPPNVNTRPRKGFRAGLDLGTANGSVSIHFPAPDTRATINRIYIVQMREHHMHFPMIGGYIKGEFMWGVELADKLYAGEVQEEDVIHFCKLGLYPSHANSKIVSILNRQPRRHGKTLTQFLADLIHAIDAGVFAYVERSGLYIECSREEMEYEVRVPQMWTPTSTKQLMDAIQLADLPSTELVLPGNPKGLSPYKLEPGEVMQLLDLGGGTADSSPYKVGSSTDTGAEIVLRLVGIPEGRLCGGFRVNQAFVSWLETDYVKTTPEVTIRKLCNRLGLSKLAFEARASAAFEEVKKKDFWPDPVRIMIDGEKGEYIRVEFSRSQMQKFFDPVIDEIIQMIHRQMHPRTKMIYISGGFGSSRYLLERLRAVFDAKDMADDKAIKIWDGYRTMGDAHCPVSTGALLRHQNIADRGMPTQYAFGITQVEDWDPNHHPDATHLAGTLRGHIRRAKPEPMVPIARKSDPFLKSHWIVENRWKTLLPKGALQDADETFSQDTYQLQYLVAGAKSFTQTVYWTETDIRDHEPVKIGNKIVDNVYVWDEFKIEVDPKAYGYEPEIIPGTGRKAYEVWWRLRMSCKGANVELKWQILRAGTQPFDLEGKPINRDAAVAMEKEFSISNKRYNPFALDTAMSV
ncbi:hypothetical protein LTR85_006792 [Meristemomyces frigidus]|nr:hypothetical protein LTR85_006792 [Meristemomyces frigidus]